MQGEPWMPWRPDGGVLVVCRGSWLKLKLWWGVLLLVARRGEMLVL